MLKDNIFASRRITEVHWYSCTIPRTNSNYQLKVGLLFVFTFI